MNTLRHGIVLTLLAVACGRDTEQSDVKLVGVGSNPDEIGPTPDDYGGIVELDYVDFAGGSLPLGLMGFLSYDPIEPSATSGFGNPPYRLVYGLGFIMESDLPNPDALFGNWARPPEEPGVCQTVYQPQSYLNNLADVGPALHFTNADGTVDARIARYPSDYPPDPRNVFTYYFGVETLRTQTSVTYQAPTGDDILAMESEILPSNWAFGETLQLGFAGAIPPEGATVGSIPLPLASTGEDSSITLPTDPQGVMMSWTGHDYRHDDSGNVVVSEDVTVNRCLWFKETDTPPSTPEDCLSAPSAGGLGTDIVSGQLYTIPWETTDGVTFSWIPSEADETVSITVRFLKAMDMDDPYLQVAMGPDGREASVCEDDITWQTDVDYFSDEDQTTPVPTLQGDPTSKLAEVTCTVEDKADDSGYATFTLTADMLAEARAYGEAHGMGGALFYFNRSTRTAVKTPPVRDAYGQRRDIQPILVVSNAVQIGRMWIEN